MEFNIYVEFFFIQNDETEGTDLISLREGVNLPLNSLLGSLRHKWFVGLEL